MSGAITETPERWSIVKITSEGKTYYKVFGSWRGGYLSGDSWRMNSGIVKVEEDEESFYFLGESGSKYKCGKDLYGTASSYTEGILYTIKDKAPKANAILEIMSEETDWINLLSESQ